MITPDYARMMASYNRWQNRNVFSTASRLQKEDLEKDRGAFFNSILGTLNHILWADRIWMHRLAGSPRPSAASIAASVTERPDWPALQAARGDMDGFIVDWANGLQQDDMTGDLHWFSSATGRDMTLPRGQAIAQVFNHQTHHRGQVHAMLTAAGATPDVTDLAFLPAGAS